MKSIPLSKREFLEQPIQMKLPRNPKIFAEFSASLPKSTQNFEYFGKKDEPQRLLVSETIDC